MTPDPGTSALSGAAQWLQAVLLGPAATAFAVLAIASVGFLMLSGRLHWRRGATALLGCFILFGAPAIAAGLIGAARSGQADGPPATAVEPVALPGGKDGKPPNPVCSTCGPATPSDPYAGAYVPG